MFGLLPKLYLGPKLIPIFVVSPTDVSRFLDQFGTKVRIGYWRNRCAR
jgi:hypothetical protein